MDRAAPRRSHRLLGEILCEQGTISEAQLREALGRQKELSQPLGKVLVTLGFTTPQAIMKAIGNQAGMEVVDLEHLEIPAEVIASVTSSIARLYKIVPIRKADGVLTVAMADPLNMSCFDDLRFMLNCEIRGAVSNEEEIEAALKRYFRDEEESYEEILQEADATGLDLKVDLAHEETVDLEKLTQLAEAAPVRKLLNLVLLQAIREKASDIHFEPFESEFKIRYRIDGVLYEMMPPPPQLGLALTSRIKVMSNLDIAERRLPQDGRIELSIGQNPVELRVSTLPTMNGESVVLRVLDRSVVSLELDKVGMTEDELVSFRNLLQLPNGIMLVTGPTGSGKTTTLYSAINELNRPMVKIITVEDPVEYDIPGVIQVEVDEPAGRNFSSALRSILRQDPDIILVGEIRDLETASLAIEASLTGHLVFSTLHTNDAPTAITRLIDLGVEPFLVAATCEAVLAQRLVRTICTACKVEYDPSREELMELNLSEEEAAGKRFCYGRGCENCNNTGYRGRMGLFETMILNDELKNLIMSQVSTSETRRAAVRLGMRPLRQSGLLRIFDGLTTIEEVVRATQLGS